MPLFTMGIDIGSTTCKGIILKNGAEIVTKIVLPLGTGTRGAKSILNATLDSAGLAAGEIARIVATGYGRFSCEAADNQKSELNCHAAGIHYLLPTARTVIDIGGQDSKVLRINEQGALENFVMNDKCAAGTGRFLDVMAALMGLRTEELGPLSESAAEVVSISNTCTVFAESEIISKMSANVGLPDLAAGIHSSVAKRVAGLAFRLSLKADVAMSGGVAKNGGVARALEKELKSGILIHEDCQLAGALGAALFAYKEARGGK